MIPLIASITHSANDAVGFSEVMYIAWRRIMVAVQECECVAGMEGEGPYQQRGVGKCEYEGGSSPTLVLVVITKLVPKVTQTLLIAPIGETSRHVEIHGHPGGRVEPRPARKRRSVRE